jgi:hypothetical protein
MIDLVITGSKVYLFCTIKIFTPVKVNLITLIDG